MPGTCFRSPTSISAGTTSILLCAASRALRPRQTARLRFRGFRPPLAAHLREVAARREMHVPSQKQVCARDAPGALLLARERWLIERRGDAPPPAHERHSEPTSTDQVELA
jgi:hypothetical protein